MVSEKMIISHCAPTLAGIKAGNLFSCSYENRETLLNEVRLFNRRLYSKGLHVLPLRYKEKRALVYVYRPAVLRKDLSQQSARSLLQEAGYSEQNGAYCLKELMQRLQNTEDFPHEIGLFLSYPPEDVRGFMENGAQNFKCSGCWKVYGDTEKTQRLFRKYKRCTDWYMKQWAKGIAVERLAV